MSDPTKPPPNPPGPWDHEDPPDGARPKSPTPPKRPAYKPGAEPKPWPSSQRSETPHKGATLGWLDEPAAPGDYAEIIRRAARDGDLVPAEMDDAAPCPVCIAAPCACDADDHDHAGEPCHACMAEEEE